MYTKAKILIADDSLDLLDALKLFLEERSYRVCTVFSEELFTSELKNFKPDVIILDVRVKSMGDGREICRSIKSDNETKNIPVILMSADYKALENYKECSADAVIEKPFNLLELTKQIESVVNVNIGNNLY